MRKLGEKLWQLREAKGLSQEALAEKVEVSRQTISNWENDRATPDAYKLRQLCEVLGVSADTLLETEEHTSPAGSEGDKGKENVGPDESRRHPERVCEVVLLAVLGSVAALLVSVAVVLFTLPEEQKTQAITSVFTLSPTTGGIFLLVLAAALLVAITVLLFKKRK